MLEPIILGIIQGVTEWLPISSDGFLVLAQINIFGHTENISKLMEKALFLHLGTFLAALIYFRKDVWHLLKSIFSYSKKDVETKNTLKFIIFTTLISGILGLLILFLLKDFEEKLTLTGKTITLITGFFLLLTAFFQIKQKGSGFRTPKEIKNSDIIATGFAQGIAALPGLSRSGLTVAVLLLKKFDDFYALKLSFLMSIPIVFLGNIILNYRQFTLETYNISGVFFAFIFGILTIDLLIKLAKKINFGYFVMIFGILTIIAVLI